MSRMFEKHETLFCILLIVIYLVSNSVCIQLFGETSFVGFVVNTVLSLCLAAIMVALKKTTYYGLTKAKNPKAYLYFLPLVVIVTVNLWNGININNTPREILIHILTMINIGFIEEIIFRGFLFRMMEKNGVKSAIIVSSVTFGVGHIINLLNGAELVSTLLQIVSAISIGYLFVVIFHKSQSLIACIITHSMINSLSVFYVEEPVIKYVAPVFLIIVPLLYANYINRKVKESDEVII